MSPDQPARIRLEDLTPDQLEPLKEWARLHGVDPNDIPAKHAAEVIRLDPTTNEWIIPRFSRDDHGQILTDPDLEACWRTVRRANKADLPWPLVTP